MRNLIVAAGALALSLSAAADQVRQSGQLRNIVIEGESRIQMRGDKPLDMPAIDPQKPLGDFLEGELRNANPIDRLAPDIPALFPTPVASDVILSPWRRHLIFPPVLDFSVDSPPRVSVTHWRFIVTDDRGKVFRLIQGKKRLPERILWDGLGDGGEPMRVGHPYAYSLNVLDRAGVPTYISGRSVRMSSYVYETPGMIIVNISPDALFDKGNELTTVGMEYMRETRDALRKVWNSSMVVNSYGPDGDLAFRQADAVRKYLEGALHLPAGWVGAHGRSLEKDQYVRVEIVVK